MNNKNEMPLITIFIPSFNHEKYVLYAISSAILQNYENIELLIIDDGSKDNSVSVITEYISKLNTSIKNKITFLYGENKGLCGTFNQAIAISNGKYILMLASDDILLKNALSLMVNAAISDDTIAAVAGNIIEIDPDNQYIPLWINKLKRNLGVSKYIDFNDIFTGVETFSATACYKKQSLEDVGGFDTKMWIEDFQIQLKLLNSGYNVYKINEFLVLYRRHYSNMSSDNEKLQYKILKIREQYSERPDYNMLMDVINNQDRKANSQNVKANSSAIYMVLKRLYFLARSYAKSFVKIKYRYDI